MITTVRRFLNDAAGATAIEYALIAVVVSIAIATAANVLGTRVLILYTSVSNSLSGN